jgi:L-ascorbate metabolism protein UlaG (beta-lactamase superfamily)
MLLTGKRLLEDINAFDCRKEGLAFWWLGQHSFILKVAGRILYIDPFLSDHGKRLVPPLLDPGEITNADLVLGTHDHRDHIDREIWPALAAASPQSLFVVPEAKRPELIEALQIPATRFRGIDAMDSIEIAGITISAVPAAHENLEPCPVTGRYSFLGYVIEADGWTVYHPGDTCRYEGMPGILSHWRFDVAFLPINGRDGERFARNCIGNMTFQEAVDLAGEIRPGLTVPTHFDMFAGNREDPKKFVDYAKAKYPKLSVRICRYGERVVPEKGI